MRRESDEFIALLTGIQNPLYGYIRSLLPDPDRARDVLQETNRTIWHKAEQFEEGTHFPAWATRIAYFHVLSHRRKMSRDRLVFDDQLVDYLAERASERMESPDPRRVALQHCLQSLPEPQRGLVKARYEPGGSVQEVAERLQKSAGAISQLLFRIRKLLMQCIESRLAQQEPS